MEEDLSKLEHIETEKMNTDVSFHKKIVEELEKINKRVDTVEKQLALLKAKKLLP